MKYTTTTKPDHFDTPIEMDTSGTPPRWYKDPFTRKPVSVEEKVKAVQPALHRALKLSALDSFSRRW